MLGTCVCGTRSFIMMCYLIVTLQKQLKYFLFPACLLFMHYITFVVMLFAGYLKFCIITYMWGYVIVALLCKIASEWYITIVMELWYFSQFTILIFDVVKGGEAYVSRSREAQSQGSLLIQEMHRCKFCHHQKRGVCECNFNIRCFLWCQHSES